MDNDDKRSNTKSTKTIALVMGMIGVLVVILLLVLWIFVPDPPIEPKTATPGLPQQTLPEPAPESEPEPQPAPVEEEPAPPEEPQEPLPPLGESDQALRQEVEQLPNGSELLAVLVRDDLIRKTVRAVTALEEGALVNKYRPVMPPSADFEAEEVGKPASETEPQKYRMTEETYQRYDSYIDMLADVDAESLAALYNRYYPLLEQAYEEQGVDKGSFREVTLTAIETLLEAPVMEEDILLTRPSVMYKYADPELEALPPAHKLMLRMGPDNNRKLKGVLRQLRSALQE